MLKENSIPGLILKFIHKSIIIPIINKEIIEEYLNVLSRNKFDISKEMIEKEISYIKAKGIFLEREQTIEDFIDKDDIVFFEIVLSARSTMDAYLVTGNMKHYPIRSYVVTPREMIEIIEKENGSIQI